MTQQSIAEFKRSERVAIVGLGYVGLPIALRTVAAGYDVVGVEVDSRRFESLREGISYVEDIADHELAEATITGRFTVVNSIADAVTFDIAVIAVPTPLRDGAPDLAYVRDATTELGKLLAVGGCVILESTTYPGTTEDLMVPLLEAVSGLRAGTEFHAGFSPERIDPGNLTWTLATTPKIVSGIDAGSAKRIGEFYSAIVDNVVPVSGPKVAELAKLLENTYRHVNIALINELAIFAYQLGIDIWEVVDAAATKPFGFQRFTPGPGVGGHCLPIDPSYLSWQVRRQLGHAFRFVELANDVNEHMPDYVVRRIQLALNDIGLAVKGSRLLLLGLAYKKNSGDARESPAVRVAELLAELGSNLRVVDPLVKSDFVAEGTRAELTVEEVSSADLVVVLTDHDELDWDMVLANGRHIFDTRNRLRGDHVQRI
ncbi:MAG TPA: nucleotide sugar dehydrogenase [Ilumatobacteraceae bacterium]|nr:nucleotide sugar dehydrogenase [Ilumatobacteraceae bacterium]